MPFWASSRVSVLPVEGGLFKEGLCFEICTFLFLSSAWSIGGDSGEKALLKSDYIFFLSTKGSEAEDDLKTGKTGSSYPPVLAHFVLDVWNPILFPLLKLNPQLMDSFIRQAFFRSLMISLGIISSWKDSLIAKVERICSHRVQHIFLSSNKNFILQKPVHVPIIPTSPWVPLEQWCSHIHLWNSSAPLMVTHTKRPVNVTLTELNLNNLSNTMIYLIKKLSYLNLNAIILTYLFNHRAPHVDGQRLGSLTRFGSLPFADAHRSPNYRDTQTSKAGASMRWPITGSPPVQIGRWHHTGRVHESWGRSHKSFKAHK